VPLRIGEAWLAEVKATIRNCRPHGGALRKRLWPARIRCRSADADARVERLLRNRGARFGDAKTAANWVMGDLAGALKAEARRSVIPVSAENWAHCQADRGGRAFPASWPRKSSPRCFRPAIAAAAIVERERLKAESATPARSKR